jgi:hypothetical protein
VYFAIGSAHARSLAFFPSSYPIHHISGKVIALLELSSVAFLFGTNLSSATILAGEIYSIKDKEAFKSCVGIDSLLQDLPEHSSPRHSTLRQQSQTDCVEENLKTSQSLLCWWSEEQTTFSAWH